MVDPQISFEDATFNWGFKIKQKEATGEDAQSPTKKGESPDKSASPSKKGETPTKSAEKKDKPAKLGVVELESSAVPVLHNISLNMKKGDLLTVVGRVGCGKTSLLMSVMEETILESGKSKISGKIAYVEQEPFIVSDTVANNIMFGQEFDKDRMRFAIESAQMQSDLKLFNRGINTTIGERGVNISGGQKARISLARAVYSKADIVLLDDPLSAVDPEVANKIFR